ncbi:DRMBL-domain-containing protein [Aulographum hederae CBS 113979]|uniref:DRMBL-domain-containing protein n=1 Tax=Aulographum hederae CBS 113979 TaxID=1176131 RepID=A0A6G1H9E2_9PEZI|nr:DRMBL-domain-containing protein [Aulographum hederae CBS 113979]
MFRNPRENTSLPPGAKHPPSTGRPPSPPASPNATAPRQLHNAVSLALSTMPPKKPSTPSPTTSNKKATVRTPNPKKTLGGKATNGVGNSKLKPKPNGSILSFFKKEEQGLFLEDNRGNANANAALEGAPFDADSENELYDDLKEEDSGNGKFNEDEGPVKRRKLEESPSVENAEEKFTAEQLEDSHKEFQESAKTHDVQKRVGPFLQDSDSEEEEVSVKRSFLQTKPPTPVSDSVTNQAPSPREENIQAEEVVHPEVDKDILPEALLLLKREDTSYASEDGFGGFDDLEDFEDDEFPDEGEEFQERRWIEEQKKIEISEGTYEEDDPDCNEGKKADLPSDVPNADAATLARCPICNTSLTGITDEQASVHVNNCLDGKPTPIPERQSINNDNGSPSKPEKARQFQRPIRPAKPGQENPFTLGTANNHASAFSKIMSNHAEDAAWATAAAAENKSRGRPAYERTCPFYKILPGFFICVDAFRYGAVQDCQAYFLSHFHSDHYIGLTSSWCHGPIYCSRVTGNLVRQQLRVDPKWVVDLESEKEVEVPNTQGVKVTMIPANHCPGSSLFLFEKFLNAKSNPPKVQRVLHCGDFRACRAHIEHPLLRPDVMDKVSGKNRQQKLDVCYLDTTYLNPKYAFPNQEEVITACANMCVSLNKIRKDEDDGWEQMKRDRAGNGMVKFVQKGIKPESETDVDDQAAKEQPKEELQLNKRQSTLDGPALGPRGRLLVVVGTYSIGKERICLGIARALESKIYAPAPKMRICRALEDPELNALLTSDPREAQVHMTPLFEIRAETLDDYLQEYRDTFSRAVGFRPSGWNYRPPNSRFIESPSVSTVLHGANWKSAYSMKELVPQRGSTSRAACFGVPYSEHSSFRELTMFCCALRIDRIIPTVNVGSAKGREKMRAWCDRWAQERRKNGLFKPAEGEW